MVLSTPIHILGAGAVGMLFASKIKLVFPKVDLLVRKTALSKQRTICLKAPKSPPQLVPVPLDSVSSTSPPIQLLLVTTKAFDVQEALRSVQHRLCPSSKIVLLCNGSLSVRQELQDSRDFVESNVLYGTTSHGVYYSVDGAGDDDDPLYTVHHVGQGDTILHDCSELTQLLVVAGLATSSTGTNGREDIETILWRKLAANCVINPLTAVHKIVNGEIVHLPHFEGLYRGVLEEVQAVCQSHTGQTVDFRPYCDNVIATTASNQSSMLVDVKNQRKTEIEHLNGFVVKLGRRYGIECPNNQLLCETLRDFA